MQDKRYILVVMDSTGAKTRRITVMRSTILRLATTILVLLALGTATAIHAVHSAEVARESLDIHNENKALEKTVSTYTLEAEALRAKATFAEISANVALRRAGLQTEASLLASGPLDSSADEPAHNQEHDDLPALAENVRAKAKVIDLEMERLIEDLRDSRLLQNTLH